MKALIIVLVGLFSLAALADCKSDIETLKNPEITRLYLVDEFYITEAKEIRYKRDAEKVALADYLNISGIKLTGKNKINYITEQYQNRSRNTSTGYKVIVTNSDNDLSITYTIKIDASGLDVAYLLLSKETSEETTLVCETL
jgi:hypothetical protein